jgi:Kef-type K+ transport system membrane component KefB
MQTTDLGTLALACAATDDLSAWCLLALVVGVAQAQVAQALVVTLLAAGYLALVFFVVRPIMVRFLRRIEGRGLTPALTGAVLVGVLLSSLVTEAIGVHAIFGAFLFGAVIPHDSPIARALSEKLGDFITILLLPAFFALSGMRTQIGLVEGPAEWLTCLAIIAVATLGKFGGTLAAARAMGVAWRESAALGILMNTRGLMELIVLNIGLDLGVISPTLFAMMVMMALATTLATSPILATLVPRASATARQCDQTPGESTVEESA